MKNTSIAIFALLLLSQSCTQITENPAGKDGWLKGSKNEKFDNITQHLRGFDMAMVETDYRYQELYWAGQDSNWEYADYQLDKIRLTIENGLQRRPKRAASAQYFLNVALPDMQDATASGDSIIFFKKFEMLTNACNSCHVMEKVSHFSVKTPLIRQSSIRK